MKRPKQDILVTGGGTTYLVHVLTEVARNWDVLNEDRAEISISALSSFPVARF